MSATRPIVVLGMHRSGTSAVGGLLSELGVFMGKSLFAPQKNVNEKGFYENAAIVGFNESLFDAALSSWDDPLLLDKAADFDSLYASHGARAAQLLQREYGDKDLWGMKDPRMSVLLPFWTRVFADCGLQPAYLVLLRHPAEVVASLRRRDGFSAAKTLSLWLAHTIEAFLRTGNARRLVVSYDQLCAAPAECARRLVECCGLAASGGQISAAFIDAGLRNQRASGAAVERDDPLQGLALRIYEGLVAETATEADVCTVRDEFTCRFMADPAVLREHLVTVKRSEVHYRQLFEEAYGSLWWKAALPFKKLEEAIRGNARHGPLRSRD